MMYLLEGPWRKSISGGSNCYRLALNMVTIPTPKKTWLLVKEESEDGAQEQFHDSGINIETSGWKHLGAALGSVVFTEEYISAKVSQ